MTDAARAFPSTAGHPPGRITRRRVLSLAAGAVAAAGAGGGVLETLRRAGSAPVTTMPSGAAMVGPNSPLVGQVDALRHRSGRPPLQLQLTPSPVTVDLAGRRVDTWAFAGTPGAPEIRLQAGDTLSALVHNGLPEPTTVHWHGLAIRNNMDGADGMTQVAVPPGARFLYDFVVPDPGTYFYHPHYGLQLDRGLYGPLIVEDPTDPGVDVDASLVLDDWLDGVDGTPDEAMARILAIAHGQAAPDALIPPLGSMMSSLVGGMTGDIAYPAFLVNGGAPSDRRTVSAPAGGAVRLRIINAGADTAFQVAIGGHSMTVTHADGYPVVPVEVDSLVVGMAERYDVVVRPRSGAWPVVALPLGKRGMASAILRTTDAPVSAAPPSTARPAELSGRLLEYSDLHPAPKVRLAPRPVDREYHVDLIGNMAHYTWAISGPDVANLNVRLGERVRIVMHNVSDMFHPMHLHGHTYAAVDFDGVRKDTLIVPPGTTRTIEVECDNPGTWMFHCHNLYHFRAGMATTFNYFV